MASTKDDASSPVKGPHQTADTLVHPPETAHVAAPDATAHAPPSPASSHAESPIKTSPPPEKMEKPAASGPAPEEQRSKSETALSMLALCLAVFLAALDMTIITTALPTIAAEFHSSEADYTWVGSCYLLAAAAAGPTWGKVSDIFGRKPVLLMANFVFFIGSLICALSINVGMLEAGRVIQGIGGGGLIILVNVCISDLFSMRTRGLYFGLVGMTWAIASALGPVIGGAFTQRVTWRWNFYINLPIDGVAFVMLVIFLKLETPRTPIMAGLKTLDWLGTLTLVGGTVMFLLGLEFGGVSFPWNSATVICLIIFGIITLVLFIVMEGFVAVYPLMPLRLFKSRSNAAAYATCFAHGFTFIAGTYFLPLYFQLVLGASPLLSGVYLFPLVISLSIVSAITGVIIRKTGKYLPLIWGGLVLMTIGFGLMITLPSYYDWPRIIIFQIIAGVGTGPLFMAPLIAIQSRVPGRDIASATATFGFVRNLSTAVSVVIGGVILQNQVQQRIEAEIADPNSALNTSLPPEDLPALQQAASSSAGTGAGAVQNLPPGPAQDDVLQAYTSSLSVLWIFYTAVIGAGLLISLLISRRTLSKQHEVTKTGLAAQEQGRREEAAHQAEKKRRRSEMAAAKKASTSAAPGPPAAEHDLERGHAAEEVTEK